MYFAVAVLFHLLYLALGLAIFKSLFHRNRRNGILVLVVISSAAVYQLTVGYSHSLVLGMTLTVTTVAMGIITYVMTKRNPSFSEAM